MSSPASLSDHSGHAHAYSRLDRLLHRIALGSRAVLHTSLDLEQARHGRAAAALTLRTPVFVAGLARAGTTLLMQRLHQADRFAALTYRDLPFPLAPNLWAGLTAHSRRHVARTERGHGDGMDHDLDSPEAIEEVFWRAHDADRMDDPDGLVSYTPDAATLTGFATFMRLVCLRHGGDRYLSKNNANILRLAALARAFPDATWVHPFRDPLDQALSLWTQHRRACELGQADPFRADFMRWLGHHEFGVAQRALLLPPGSRPPGDPAAPAFWLRTWIGAYTHLLTQPADVAARQCFVDYDRLTSGEADLREALAQRLGLASPISGEGLRPPRHRVTPDLGIPPEDLRQARAIHVRLIARAI